MKKFYNILALFLLISTPLFVHEAISQCPFPSMSYTIDGDTPTGPTAVIEVEVDYPSVSESHIQYVDLDIVFSAPAGFTVSGVTTTAYGDLDYSYNSSSEELSITYDADGGDETLSEVFGTGVWLYINVSGPQNFCYEITYSTMSVEANDDGGMYYYYCFPSATNDIDDCFGACSSSGSISGNISLRGDHDLQGIYIELYDEYGNYITYTNTNSSGNYSFSNLCLNYDYELVVDEYSSYPCDVEGDSDDDQYELTQKILYTGQRDEYYHMEGDLNENGAVSGADAIEIYKKDVGTSTLNINWIRFVTEDDAATAASSSTYVYDDEWNQPRVVSAGTSNVDFHGVDVGDVDRECDDYTRSSKAKTISRKLYYDVEFISNHSIVVWPPINRTLI